MNKNVMGALTTTIYNPMFREQYQRLLSNGKYKMVAAANKLLRQAFGVLKSGKPFDTNYRLCSNI